MFMEYIVSYDVVYYIIVRNCMILPKNIKDNRGINNEKNYWIF